MDTTNNYISVMIESLQKKILILTEIVCKNEEQTNILSKEPFDMDIFEGNVNSKSELIDDLQILDDGFDALYIRVKEVLDTDRARYKNEIIKMKELISQITELSVKIQSMESHNKILAQKQFGNLKKEVQTARRSGKMANTYYQAMNKIDYEPQFMDQKK